MMYHSNLMIIDWISVAINARWEEGVNEYIAQKNVLPSIETAIPGLLFCFSELQPGGRRFPYAGCLRSNGITIYYDGNHSGILIEISGQGCQKIRDENPNIFNVIFNHRITRIDIANDLGDKNPMELVDQSGYSNRIKSLGKFSSDTGDTVYVGSRKSKLYCRVYKYHSPHPRSNQARCEVVIKHERATQARDMLLAGSSLEDVFSAALGQLGMNTEVFNVVSNTRFEKLSSVKSLAKTEGWLHRQVYPAIAKLIANEVISLDNVVSDITALLE